MRPPLPIVLHAPAARPPPSLLRAPSPPLATPDRCTLPHRSPSSFAAYAMASEGGPPVQASAAGAVDLFHLLSNLKTTKRTGWVNHGVEGPESIADHMYRMSVMAFIGAGEAGLDQAKCVQLAIAHDIAEAVVGDITPNDPITKEEKHKLESDAVQRIKMMLGGAASGQQIQDLWNEYENAATPEAELLKDLDKLEMILQADEYEAAQEGKDLSDFFRSTSGKFKTPVGQKWAEEVVRRREGRRGGEQGGEGAAK